MRAAILAAVLLVSTLAVVAPRPVVAEDPALLLKVGMPDDMKTRNPLSTFANDPWSRDVLDRVYDSPLHFRPNGTLAAYLAKGVDADEDGLFETSEYDTWAEVANPATPLEVVAYYDFNGARWHDGAQIDVWDLLFSYHVGAMNPTRNASLRALFVAGANTSYEDGGRQLNVSVTAKSWEGEGTMAGDASLRVAVRFRLAEPYVRFYDETLAPVLLPMHVWSGTWGGRHADFGCAVYVPPAIAAAKGLPCGSTDPTRYGQGVPPADTLAFHYAAAEAWNPGDADVIGSGPFRFQSWAPGAGAHVTRNDDYYVGGAYDPRLASVHKKPRIEGIRFLVYKTTQLAVFALQTGEIDFYRGYVHPEFVPQLLMVPMIAIELNAGSDAVYGLAYNMRREPWGYRGGDPREDGGYWFRQAVSHLIDRRSVVQTLLQNFGVVAYGFLSQANPFWYDDTIPRPQYSPSDAVAILDSPEARAAGIGADPPGECLPYNMSGCRSLPLIGQSPFVLLTPVADYDPVRASATQMIGYAMRSVGLNAVTRPTYFAAIVLNMSLRDFDLALLGWRIGPDPDHLFEYFHSSNAASGGSNDVGFANATFDGYIETSRRELDREARRTLIRQAHGVLMAARPVEPIYQRTNIEAYRQDRFVNWTVVDGTIWNYWSLLGIRPPIPSTWPGHLRVSVGSAMPSLGWEEVTVTVTDGEGRALAGATVELRVDSGNLTIGGTTGRSVSATTDVSGRVHATLKAPFVEAPSLMLLQARASHPDLSPSPEVSFLVRVYPAEAQFLSISIELPIGDILGPGNALPVRIDVRNQAGEPTPDAVVNVTTSNETLLRPSRGNGTAADLTSLLLEADASIANMTTFSLTVRAAASGYFDAEAHVPILVLPTARTYRCPNGVIVRDLGDCPPGAETDALPLVLAAVGVAVAASAVSGFVIVRRRRAR